MRYFAFSDVHGCLRPLKEGLARAGYDPDNKEHHLLFLGDAFDKKSDQRDDYGVWLFLKENVERGRLTWIMGNHDVYLINVLTAKKMNSFCRDTVRNIALGYSKGAADDAECIKILLDNGVDSFIRTHGRKYFETDNYVFTHSFIPYDKKAGAYDPDWRNAANWNYMDNGLRQVLERGIRIPGKTLVCGHIGAYYGRLITTRPDLEVGSAAFKKEGEKIMRDAKNHGEWFLTFTGDGVIGIDGRSYDTGFVNVLVVDD